MKKMLPVLFILAPFFCAAQSDLSARPFSDAFANRPKASVLHVTGSVLEVTGAAVAAANISRNLTSGNAYFKNNRPSIAGAGMAGTGIVLPLADYIHLGKGRK
jgi:hypothetical protein